MLERLIRKIDDVLLGQVLKRRVHPAYVYLRYERHLGDGLGHRIVSHYSKNPNDQIAKLCDAYGSDKGTLKTGEHPYSWSPHTYTDYYSRLFAHCRTSVTKVFECGLGTDNPDWPFSMGAAGKPGASLRVWRDYFPNAMVYGADIDRDVLFEEDRIKTFYVDQLDPEAIKQCWASVGESDFDFMVDDGLHTFEGGSTLFSHSIDRLAATGVYVIEDVMVTDMLRYKEFFSRTEYLVDYVPLYRPGKPLGGNSLVVVRKP